MLPVSRRSSCYWYCYPVCGSRENTSARSCFDWDATPGCAAPALFWLIPLGIENETRIDLRVVTAPIEQQETITRDSVTVKVNAVLWYRVSDPQKAVLNVENFRAAVQQVALTRLRTA